MRGVYIGVFEVIVSFLARHTYIVLCNPVRFCHIARKNYYRRNKIKYACGCVKALSPYKASRVMIRVLAIIGARFFDQMGLFYLAPKAKNNTFCVIEIVLF